MRISKSKKYAVEQFLIQKQIISLLELESGFYLYEMDRNLSKQEEIMDLVPEIWKYFAHMNVTGLLYPERCKRPWLSIVRGVLKNRYQLKYKACRYSTNSGSVFTMKYYIKRMDSLQGSTDSLQSSTDSLRRSNSSNSEISHTDSYDFSESDSLNSSTEFAMKNSASTDSLSDLRSSNNSLLDSSDEGKISLKLRKRVHKNKIALKLKLKVPHGVC